MASFSASALARVDACPASAVLPQITQENERAERGSAAHAYLANLGRGMEASRALALVPQEYREWCAAIPHPGTGIVEPAFAFDVVTGKARLIGEDIGRKYGELGANEIAGSTDHIYCSGATLVVTDYKTGRTEVPPARDNLQLAFAGACAAQAYGIDDVRVVLRHVREDGSFCDDAADLDAFDHAATAERLARVHARVQTAAQAVLDARTPDLHEGEHCRYCPARQACPAKTQLIARLVNPTDVRTSFAALLTNGQAADAYEMVRRAADILKDLWAQLYARASESPISLPNGKVFGPVATQSESVDGAIAFAVLEKEFGADVAKTACEFTTSKAGIERALRKVAKNGELAGLKRKAMEVIAEKGGIQVKPSTSIKEHNAGAAREEQ